MNHSEAAEVGYFRGTVADYDDRAGYGYIDPEDGQLFHGERLLVHRKSCRHPFDPLRPGDAVIFTTKQVPRGLLATDVYKELADETSDLADGDRQFGTVILTHYDRNFGFVELEGNSGRRVFFHISQVPDRATPPEPGASVSFQLVYSPRGPVARDLMYERRAAVATQDPRLASDLLAEAILARDNRDYPRARALYERALNEAPTVQAVLSYAAMEKNSRRKQEAMRLYERGITLFPNISKLREDAGVLASSLSEFSVAIRYLLDALALCRSADHAGEKGILLALARTYARMDTPVALRESLRYGQEALRLFGHQDQLPEHDLLAIRLAEIRIRHHRGNLAHAFFQAAGFQIRRAQLLTSGDGCDIVINIGDVELKESYGITGDVLVRCMFKADVSPRDIEKTDEQARDLIQRDLIDEQVVWLIVASLDDNLQRMLFKRIEDRQRTAPAIIPFPQSVIETCPDPLAAIRGVLGQWLYKRDLFALNFPVVGRRFFGREKPLAELRDAILTGTPAGVFGLRKVGKTSLLKETERRSSEIGDLVVYIDLLRLPADVTDTRWLYWKIAQELHARFPKHLGEMKWRLGGLFGDFFDIPAHFPVATAFDADCTRLLRIMEASSVSPKPKVVLLLDEIERLLPNNLGKAGFEGFFDFFSYLRGVAQETSSFALVVTGANASIAERAQFDGRDNPVFNFFREIYLQLLEPSECEAMLRTLGRGMGLRFSEDAAQRIFELTGGHPFFARQLCSFVAAQRSERPLQVTSLIVNGVLPLYLEVSGKDFREIMERLERDYPQELEVCMALARHLEPVPLPQVDEMRARPSTLLRHLIGYQIITVRNGSAALTMELLRQWLHKGYANA